MSEMNSTFYGIPLKNPLVAGASSFTARPEKAKEMESAGIAAIIIKSIFEEELQLEEYKLKESLERYNDLHAEMITHYPHLQYSGDQEHLLMVKNVKEAVTIPVIASVNAVTREGWIKYAKDLEAVGVDGLELNFYSLPLNEIISSEEIETGYVEVLKAVKAAVTIPVGVKLSPFYTNISGFVKNLDDAGADGITLFNRFFQPDIDILKETESVTFSFSQVGDSLLPLRWTALLSDKVSCPITSANGILDEEDVIKALLVGASSVQIVSTLYKNGTQQIKEMLEGVEKWMELKGYASVEDFRGRMSKDKQHDPWAYERVQYIEMLIKKSSMF